MPLDTDTLSDEDLVKTLRKEVRAAYKRAVISDYIRRRMYFFRGSREFPIFYRRRVVGFRDPKKSNLFLTTYCLDRWGNIYTGDEWHYNRFITTEVFAGFSWSGVNKQMEKRNALECGYQRIDMKTAGRFELERLLLLVHDSF